MQLSPQEWNQLIAEYNQYLGTILPNDSINKLKSEAEKLTGLNRNKRMNYTISAEMLLDIEMDAYTVRVQGGRVTPIMYDNDCYDESFKWENV